MGENGRQSTPKAICVGSTILAILTITVEGALGEIQEHPPTSFGERSPLPLPSSMGVAEYEAQLFEFLNQRSYKALGWISDKRIRDTGPYLHGKYYGTHPAVQVFYSPEMMQWLQEDKQKRIPDGAMIVKEQYDPPAVRYDGVDDEELFERLSSWTVMAKDSAGSHDGWFWSNPAKDQEVVDIHSYPFDYPISGFGIYCVRCHASTKTTGETNEYTFASLRNIRGYPGEPLIFRVDDSWRDSGETEVPLISEDQQDTSNERVLRKPISADANASHPRCSNAQHPELCNPLLNQNFLALFPTISSASRDSILRFPPVTHDWVVRRPAHAQATQPFVTSNQCMSCHAGLVAPFGPTMFVHTTDSTEYGAPGVHLSPYGEWRWTPMGLSGRDPVFFAQLESEVELMRADFSDDPQKSEKLVTTLIESCLKCHGAMGKHQHQLDHGDGEAHFGLEHVYTTSTDQEAKGPNDWQYGALARDGISCAICHQMQPREQPPSDHRHYLEYFLETSITGNIHWGNANEVYGPFEDKEISPYSMEHALGIKPKHSEFIKSSQHCGTCHVVNLPIVDKPYLPHESPDELAAAEQNQLFKKYHHHIEQATYLEWLNSEYENEFNKENPKGQSCQDCHMAKNYRHSELAVDMEKIQTRIATIQDTTYPDAENLADHQELLVRHREEGYSRHNFRGLNVFLLEMFNQFDDVLGVRKYDFMTGSTEDIPHAIADFVRQGREEVASLDLDVQVNRGRELIAEVTVHNKVGHRFPSGVGFRRAFLEFLLLDPSAAVDEEPRIIWSSGRTNELGVLIDGQGEILESEFFTEEDHADERACQTHFEQITSQKQVQIYETLLWSSKHHYTTSFIHGTQVIKDNRLLPRGWKVDGPHPALRGEFLKATHPGPVAKQDRRYMDGSGSDEIIYKVNLPVDVDPEGLTAQVTLYYQAIPPYFLKSLFETAPNGPATQRLHYICSNIDLDGTSIENWKLKIASASAEVK